jgi:hypothetical protein
MSIQWRPELNALINPPSCRARVVPKDSFGYAALAEHHYSENYT